MHLSVESNLEFKVEWLGERLHLDDAFCVGRMLRRAPAILGLSIDDNLQPKMEWLERSLFLTEEGLSDLVQKFPHVLCCSVETNLGPTLQFYTEALGGDAEGAARLVVQNPTLLAYSLERRLKPRLAEVRDLGLAADASLLRMLGQYPNDRWGKELQRQLWVKQLEEWPWEEAIAVTSASLDGNNEESKVP